MKSLTKNLTLKDYAITIVILGGVAYGVSRVIKKAKERSTEKKAELETSENNPFSAQVFLKNIPAGTALLTQSAARAYAKTIYDAMNVYFDEDEDKVIYSFAALPSQTMVAQVVESFELMYKRNLLEFLKNGKKTFDFGTGRLSSEDYQRILENVKRKPKYTRNK